MIDHFNGTWAGTSFSKWLPFSPTPTAVGGAGWDRVTHIHVCLAVTQLDCVRMDLPSASGLISSTTRCEV